MLFRNGFTILAWMLGLSGWALVLFFWVHDRFQPPPPSLLETLFAIAKPDKPPPIEYKDFVSILLTAIGVMVTILAAVLALAAVWGFSIIREEAVKSAAKSARKISTKVATDVAQSVALRIARTTSPAETTADDAGKIAEAMGNDEPE